MKKIVSILLLAATLMFALSACGMGKPKIEDYEWKMRTIAHVEGEQLVYDAAAKESTAHPEAKIIEMTLVAKDKQLPDQPQTMEDYLLSQLEEQVVLKV